MSKKNISEGEDQIDSENANKNTTANTNVNTNTNTLLTYLQDSKDQMWITLYIETCKNFQYPKCPQLQTSQGIVNDANRKRILGEIGDDEEKQTPKKQESSNKNKDNQNNREKNKDKDKKKRKKTNTPKKGSNSTSASKKIVFNSSSTSTSSTSTPSLLSSSSTTISSINLSTIHQSNPKIDFKKNKKTIPTLPTSNNSDRGWWNQIESFSIFENEEEGNDDGEDENNHVTYGDVDVDVDDEDVCSESNPEENDGDDVEDDNNNNEDNNDDNNEDDDDEEEGEGEENIDMFVSNQSRNEWI